MIKLMYKFITAIFTDTFSKDILYGIANSVTIIVGICSLLTIAIKAIYTYKLKHLAITDRPDWLSEEEFYNHIHIYVKTRIRDVKGNEYTFSKFIKKVIIKGKNQYHLILGESGTGKSTFLINLYAKYNCKFFNKIYNICCISLRVPDAINQINKIENQKNVVLLLDAFDESHEANVNSVNFLRTIEKNTRNFAKVIITSRNNFFDNNELVPEKVNINRILHLDDELYNRYYILPFTNGDVNFYIIKKYKLSVENILRSKILINKCNEIISRPVILSYIDLFIENKINVSNSYNIYEQIIYNWIKREAFFISAQNKEIDVSVIVEQMTKLINSIAIFMYKNYPVHNDYYILIDELNQFDNAYYLNHTDGKRNRSLFDRVDDKLFFVHKSIFEYLLATNLDKIFFRFEKNLNIIYVFLTEMEEKNSIHKECKTIFYKDYTVPNLDSLYDDNIYIMKKYHVFNLNYFPNKSEIYDMVSWYCKTLYFPLFLNNKIYKRFKIEFKIRNILIEMPNADAYQAVKLIKFNEKIIHLINELFKNAEDTSYIRVFVRIFIQEVYIQ